MALSGAPDQRVQRVEWEEWRYMIESMENGMLSSLKEHRAVSVPENTWPMFPPWCNSDGNPFHVLLKHGADVKPFHEFSGVYPSEHYSALWAAIGRYGYLQSLVLDGYECDESDGEAVIRIVRMLLEHGADWTSHKQKLLQAAIKKERYKYPEEIMALLNESISEAARDAEDIENIAEEIARIEVESAKLREREKEQEKQRYMPALAVIASLQECVSKPDGDGTNGNPTYKNIEMGSILRQGG
ncbi:hypothetical protein GGR51DRAFT_564406 [Nemania sp. FL0031]|nr:hypothetical protein GGR51DRAFT_564406 [Nemania sp. FL0031]